MLIAAFLTGMSCKTTPAENETVAPEVTVVPLEKKEPVIAKDVTQEKVNSELKKIYDNYYSSLDMYGRQEYTVVWGDTLSKITRHYYGDLTDVGEAGSRNGFYFPILMMASPDSHIVDPDLIVPGLTLTIIDLKRNLEDPAAHQAIKDSIKDIASIYDVKNKPTEVDGLIKLSNSL
jgi:nucleoid-associated protein YgaU